jgi:uncharacterized protein (DUF2126 family)/transglutaminase-like putative cysteine protease
MSTRIALSHRIEQRFERRVNLSTHWLRLRPAPHAQGIEAYSLKVNADGHFLNWARDPYENQIARLDLPEPVAALEFDVEIIADLAPINPFDFLVESYASRHPFEYPEALRKELTPYLRVEREGPRLTGWIAALERRPEYIAEYVGQINRQVRQAVVVVRGGAPAAVDVEALLHRGSGSPWELAWLLTLSLRGVGLAARFTSGYRIWLSPEENLPDEAVLHAWSEVYLPGAGWVGLDPTLGLFTAEGHIPLASAPTPFSTLPIVGDREGCGEARSETLSVQRLIPRPAAWPYEAGAWEDIAALGGLIDHDLHALDLKLGLGSGLAFVATCNAQAPEWSTAASGASKRMMAEELLTRLWLRHVPGGVLHLGQGEWYGGESLPRWRLHCFARADGRPVWRNPGLLSHTPRPLGGNGEAARHFAERLAEKLGISADLVLAAHEDGLHELRTRGVTFPHAPSPEDLRDPERRRALARRLSGTSAPPRGYVLPLRWDPTRDRWASGTWTFRRGTLYLMPGDSPLGYRLPLDSLPAGDGAVAEIDPERCQFDERPVLPEVCGELSARFTTLGPTTEATEDADGVWQPSRPPRTALCVEIREGRMHIFLPPLTHLEHYLDLVSTVEVVAEELDTPVVLEGYEPPEDHRMHRISVEPQAGILKLFLPAVETFREQWRWLRTAYGEALQVGLRSERIMADGRRRPPGGRMDLALGGRTPADSPFLRRPELLRSLIVYWQRHPSLSYFFAGSTIGSGGAAPRPDEGRDDALYELAIALERMPSGEQPYPWIADRLLRHLLSDPAGELSRGEIRVDALYPPERSALRLGRIVLRAFESPPDARMAALQSLLVMALLAYFARMPKRAEPVKFGPELHDRFLLPHVLWSDLETVIRDLNEVGYPFQPEWFKPFLELHFPVLGQVQLGDLAIELRAAHEPWPLLAEEVTAAGVARFVDSANQRVQVRCSGLVPGRHILSCNGRRVPQRATGVHGEHVAGVRYKASNPPATLHPTIPAVDALVFDLMDSWTGKVLGGCTYVPPRQEFQGLPGAPAGVAQPPEGRSEAPRPMPPVVPPPLTSGARFLPQGSGVPRMSPPPEEVDPRHPYLLDLLRVG